MSDRGSTEESSARGPHVSLAKILAALAVVTAAAVAGVLYLSASGAAGTSVRVALLSSAKLDPAVRAGLVRAAREVGVDASTLVEISAVGGGLSERAVIAGKGEGGALNVAFFGGRSHTGFSPAGELVNSGKALFISVATAGEPTTVRQVGVIGLVRSDVERIIVDSTDGDSTTIPLTRWGPDGYAFFATDSSDPLSFPSLVRAYGPDGALVGEQKVNIAPPCPPADPGCLSE